MEKDIEIEWLGRAVDEELWLLGRKIQMEKRRPAYRALEDAKDYAAALELLLDIVRQETRDPGEIRQGLATRWAQLKSS